MTDAPVADQDGVGMNQDDFVIEAYGTVTPPPEAVDENDDGPDEDDTGEDD